LGGLDGLVAKPKSDHRTVHALVMKVHGQGVPEDMHRNPLLRERRALLASRSDVLGHETLDSIAAERSAPRAGKQRVRRTAGTVPQPTA
jgi:hypothetical protein